MSKFARFVVLSVSLAFCFKANTKAQAKSTGINYSAAEVNSFDQLIEQFKGTPIFIDMWATWCSPCRRELQLTRDVKNFSAYAASNNISIVYLCFDRDDKQWKRFISQNHLTGYHVFVNQQLNADLRKRFSFWEGPKEHRFLRFGLPRHMIIDQQGNVVDSLAGKQGSKQVYDKFKLLSSR